MSEFQFSKLSKHHLRFLTSGGVGVLPTDTIYGIVTQVNNRESVKRLYRLKSRENKPGTIIASNIHQIVNLGISPRYVEKARVFWPNPISVIIPVEDTLSYAHLGKNSLAFRVVSDPQIAQLLDITGPLLTSSANKPNQLVANNINDAKKYFGDSVDFYIDGGNLDSSTASAVILIHNNDIKVFRNSPTLKKILKSQK